MKDPALWQRLVALDFPLSRRPWRLAELVSREVDADSKRAAVIVEEYRRFLYLMATAGEPVVPSPMIKKVWTLHREDRVAYEGALTQGLARPDIAPHTSRPPPHRDPAYRRTLEVYREEFGQAAFHKVWPGPELLRQQRIAIAAVFGAFALCLLSYGVRHHLPKGIPVMLFLGGWITMVSAMLWLHKGGPWLTSAQD